mgnify:CR=1 FL=1
MKKGRMTLIENVEILSNVSQKTIGYTFYFRGKQHSISLEKIKELIEEEGFTFSGII